MRSEESIITLIADIARSDDRIRAVLLNGSRANPKAQKDEFQDYDIIYIVKEMNSFLIDNKWIDVFGERLILQTPEKMTFGNTHDSGKSVSFAYLMLFKDGSRIDLTLFPIDKLKSAFKSESMTITLVDKDGLFRNLPISNDRDYHIKKPGGKEFSDCCNEFWWVSTYIAKGLARDEITYAKDMFENPVRKMFFKIIEWHIGVKKKFSTPFGKSGKNIKYNISDELWQRILSTYPDANPDNIWNALFMMTDIFRELAIAVAQQLQFSYNHTEDQNVTSYLKSVNNSMKKKKL